MNSPELSRDEIQYGNAQCSQGHPLWLVAEGYARCFGPDTWNFRDGHFAWRFTEPTYNVFDGEGNPAGQGWQHHGLSDDTEAWVTAKSWRTIDECLAFVQADIDTHQGLEWVQEGPTFAEWNAMQRTAVPA